MIRNDPQKQYRAYKISTCARIQLLPTNLHINFDQWPTAEKSSFYQEIRTMTGVKHNGCVLYSNKLTISASRNASKNVYRRYINLFDP